MRRILFLQGYCEEVDDAVQDVFVKVFRAAIPSEEALLPWFYRIILNTGRDCGRRRRSRFNLDERLRTIAETRRCDTVPEPADAALRTALTDLPPDLRECVALRFFADLSLAEIAAAQDVPLGTVKSRLHTALGRLRTTLTEKGTPS